MKRINIGLSLLVFLILFVAPIFAKHVQSLNEGEDMSAPVTNITSLLKKQCNKKQRFQINDEAWLTVRASKDNIGLADTARQYYQMAFEEIKITTGMKIWNGEELYLVEFDSIPAHRRWDVKAKSGNHYSYVTFTESDSLSERRMKIKRHILNIVPGVLRSAHIPFLDEFSFTSWLKMGAGEYAWLRTAVRFGELNSGGQKAVKERALAAFFNPDLRERLWAELVSCPWRYKDREMEGTEADLEICEASLGAVLWMEKKAGKDTLSRVFKTLWDTCVKEQRLATEDEVFEAIQAVCGEDIREAGKKF